MLDGSGILWTERNIFHISKVDLNGNRSSFVESAEGANGLGWEFEGPVDRSAASPRRRREGRGDLPASRRGRRSPTTWMASRSTR
jgi:hypothetical protein